MSQARSPCSIIYFLDFEASSLDGGSFPIEIGWAGTDGISESHLIRPCWRWTGWSPVSERIHGISRAQLEKEGEPYQEVARRVMEAFQPGVILASDNPDFDQYWLDELLIAADLPPSLRVTEIMAVYSAVAANSDAVMQAIEAESRRRRIRHRALPDAKAMLWIYHQLIREGA